MADERALDLRSERCPLTFVRLRLLLESMPVRTRATVLLSHDDVTSIRQSLEGEGHAIVAAHAYDDHATLIIEKQAEAT